MTAFQWYADLVQKNKCMPAQQINETQMLNAFLTGKVGSIFCYPSIVANIAKAPFKSASTVIPAGPVGSKSNLGCAHIGVFAKGKNKDGGWDFAKFIGLDPDEHGLLECELRPVATPPVSAGDEPPGRNTRPRRR